MKSTAAMENTAQPLGAGRALRAGANSVVPILLGVLPFGLVYGLSAVGLGLSAVQSIAMSSIIFAGASQLIFADLWNQGAPFMVILAAVLIVNLRMMMYSASLAPHFATESRGWKVLISYLITDQAYAVSIVRFGEGLAEEDKRWYYLGAALALWSTWQCATTAGVFLGSGLPASWELDFAVPLTFLALLAPSVKDRANLTAALVAGCVAICAAGLPHNLGLIVAALSGIFAGAALDYCSSKEAGK
jgi:4-azaleucine resistance transporter AzlC